MVSMVGKYHDIFENIEISKISKYDIFNIFYFRAICRFISEMMQHTAIVTMEGE